MVSGVGPAAERRSLKIPQAADLEGVDQRMRVCDVHDDIARGFKVEHLSITD